jgi:hypothetical protein
MSTTPEDQLAGRLRDAYAAAAGTVAAGSVRELPADLLGGEGRPPRRRPGRRALVAAAAAAAVVAAIVVPRALAGGAGGAGTLTQSDAPAPAFFAAVIQQPVPGGTDSHVDIVAAATGQVVARIQSPMPGTVLTAISEFGSDRTFMAAAEPLHVTAANCGSWLYRIRLAAGGSVASVTLLKPFPNTPGQGPWGLVDGRMFAASAAGQLVLYEQLGCGVTDDHEVLEYDIGGPMEWGVGYDQRQLNPTGLSMSADGTRLSVLTETSGDPGARSVWTLPGKAAPTMNPRYAKPSFGPFAAPAAAVISPAGAVTYVAAPRSAPPAASSTPSASSAPAAGASAPGTPVTVTPTAGAPGTATPATATPAASAATVGRPRGGLVLAAYRSGNGQPLGDIATLFPGEPVVPGLFLATDPSGSNLLVSDTAMRVDVVNVAFGSVTEVPVLGEATNARLVSVAW